ncbi:MAG: DUF4124 domain-containing protein [Candidatus Competibacteraceae bacterium]
MLGLFALLLATSSAWAQGTVYTWKDAQGQIHYGNRLPEGQTVEPVDLNAKPVFIKPTEHIYTWTDAKGKVHYGPQPPGDASARELKEDDSSFSTIHSGQLREGEKQLLQNPEKR